MDTDEYDGPPPATEEAIMQATYRALCKHGYAGLTMQSIADEFEKTKGVLHYHYDTKQDLLVAFLEYLLEAFDQSVTVGTNERPDERLTELIDALLFGSPERRRAGSEGDGFDHWELTTALLEIRSEAPHDAEFRRQLTRNFDAVEAMVAAVVRDGVEQGTFRDVDPERVAATILASINGARIYQVTLDRDDVATATSETLHELVSEWLCHPATDE